MNIWLHPGNLAQCLVILSDHTFRIVKTFKISIQLDSCLWMVSTHVLWQIGRLLSLRHHTGHTYCCHTGDTLLWQQASPVYKSKSSTAVRRRQLLLKPYRSSSRLSSAMVIVAWTLVSLKNWTYMARSETLQHFSMDTYHFWIYFSHFPRFIY